jgi:hypothetical protein
MTTPLRPRGTERCTESVLMWSGSWSIDLRTIIYNPSRTIILDLPEEYRCLRIGTHPATAPASHAIQPPMQQRAAPCLLGSQRTACSAMRSACVAIRSSWVREAPARAQ